MGILAGLTQALDLTREARSLIPAVESAPRKGWPAAELTEHLLRNTHGGHAAHGFSAGNDLTRCAADAGFASLSHFSRVFHSMFGLSATALLSVGTQVIVDHAGEHVHAPITTTSSVAAPQWNEALQGL